MVKGKHWILKNANRLGIEADNVNPATVDLRLSGEIVEIPVPMRSYNEERVRFQGDHLAPYRKPLSDFELYDKFPSEWKEWGILDDAYYYNIPEGVDFVFIPSAFYLARSVEFVSIPPDTVATGDSKSTTARLGINHLTALLIDPGYNGRITMELIAKLPVKFTIGSRIIQLTYHEVIEGGQYNGRYQNSNGLVPPLRGDTYGK